MKDFQQKHTLRFEEFWPIYVRLHTRRSTRWLHACAALSAIILIGAGLIRKNPLLLLAAPLVDYAIAQLSHRVFEKNITRFWLHPVLYARAELYMFFLTLGGRMNTEVKRYAQSSPPQEFR